MLDILLRWRLLPSGRGWIELPVRAERLHELWRAGRGWLADLGHLRFRRGRSATPPAVLAHEAIDGRMVCSVLEMRPAMLLFDRDGGRSALADGGLDIVLLRRAIAAANAASLHEQSLAILVPLAARVLRRRRLRRAIELECEALDPGAPLVFVMRGMGDPLREARRARRHLPAGIGLGIEIADLRPHDRLSLAVAGVTHVLVSPKEGGLIDLPTAALVEQQLRLLASAGIRVLAIRADTVAALRDVLRCGFDFAEGEMIDALYSQRE
jgi:hypothetical protein